MQTLTFPYLHFQECLTLLRTYFGGRSSRKQRWRSFRVREQQILDAVQQQLPRNQELRGVSMLHELLTAADKAPWTVGQPSCKQEHAS